MRFIIESSQYDIRIYVFNKNDLILRPDQVLFVGRYENDNTRLPPLEHKKFWVDKSQIAQAGNHIAIPEDQLKFESGWSWPRQLKIVTMQKYRWKELKDTYPYKGE